eukprot:CAMPEP_0174716792 /NCGR_PEP_ID=MMETSP1094-20130205/24765_1 /TAXON_ID=156173 /ORGANISM="Chrysochromulina brevifilum, Strain UTEX LB 985" /LENGTH=210 /DNA_ID=CAMNT_0015916615 /DNA_START=39 /DNA_END=671 /DNA_ORIENTATION=+
MAMSLTVASMPAFTPAAVPAAPATARATTPSMIEMSRSLPFLKKPPALDGTMAGDAGFDPLGFSTTITELGGDMAYVREAELMHGRQAMFATVGMFYPAVFGKLSTCADVSSNPLVAQYELPAPVLVQTAVAIAIAEGLRSRVVFSEGGVPGEHFSEELKARLISTFKLQTPEAMMDMKTKEIAHCRLAMIAWVGMFAQEAVTGSIWPLM